MNLTRYLHYSATYSARRPADIAPHKAQRDGNTFPTNWPEYFVHNHAHRLTIPWERGIAIEPPLRSPLARSLQRFQVGESGGGAHLKRVSSKHGNGVGLPGYATAIRLFVEEEQVHAALMARVLKALDAPLLGRHWSNTAFRAICALSGLHTELMVLLVTETIAKQYFSLLYANVDDQDFRMVCAQVGLDEDGHIEFHCDALRPKLSSLPAITRYLVRQAWQLFFDLICLLVIFDHRTLFRATGVPAHVFWDDSRWLFGQVTSHVLEPASNARVAAY